MRLAIIGGGWAGLAAAVRALDKGHQVTLLEMAPSLGGRARTVQQHGQHFDNGQHILIGAYTQTLGLMQRLGVDPAKVLRRLPLALTRPDGTGLALTGRSSPARFAWAIMRHGHWHWRSRQEITMLPSARPLPEPISVLAITTPFVPASRLPFHPAQTGRSARAPLTA
jgi:uncharacterized protein with NAD-binding domain and iron-sulfur cluster